MATNDIGDGAIAGIITGVIMGILALLLALIGMASLVAFVDIRSIFGGRHADRGLCCRIAHGDDSALIIHGHHRADPGSDLRRDIRKDPETSAVTRGIVFMLAIWVIFGLLIPIVVSAGGMMPAALTATGIISALIAAAIWGGLLGIVFSWVSKRTAAPARPVVR